MPIRKIGTPSESLLGYATPFSLFTLYKEISSDDAPVSEGRSMLIPEEPYEIYGDTALAWSEAQYVVYELKPGDTLWTVARNRYGDSRHWFNIWRLNALKHPLDFVEGDKIKLPQDGLII